MNALAKEGLSLIGQHWETVSDDFNEHQKEFRKRLESLAEAKPLFINTQTGKDFWPFEKNLNLIHLAQEVASKTGTKIIHETHRGKFSFAAHVMPKFFDSLPDLRITLDISHWFNVAETFLHDQQEIVERSIQHADHIHARVGFTEGPQINDPRAPEWKDVTDHHLKCWDKITDRHRINGQQLTITPEFGAPPYLPLHPYTQKPLAEQWDVNIYMMEMLRKRYETSK